jgi:hypothetical protein
MFHRLPRYVSLLIFWPIDVVIERRTRLIKLSGSAPFDNYSQPLLAQESWFSGLNKLVKGVLVRGGEQEVLIDTIDTIAQRLKVSCSHTDYVRSQGGAHVKWMSHKLLMISGKEESTWAIESRVATRHIVLRAADD